jgi:hypothetical protein
MKNITRKLITGIFALFLFVVVVNAGDITHPKAPVRMPTPKAISDTVEVPVNSVIKNSYLEQLIVNLSGILVKIL